MPHDSVSSSAEPPDVPPVAVELQTLRESQDRALHMEGIPMLIALADERGAGAVVADAQDQRHAAVVARLDHYRSALAPSQRDTDMGVIASVLTVTAYEDFDRALTP